MSSIGEFSKITGLTVKTLRFYYEEELLVPSAVDRSSGYRYYGEDQVETATAIAFLRGLECSLADIREILRLQEAGEPFVETLERHKSELQHPMKQIRKTLRSLDRFIADERSASRLLASPEQIEEKQLQPVLIAGIRMTGRYSDCSRAFAKIGRSLGRYSAGVPFLLHYDQEHKEEDADFEACMPIRTAKAVDGISLRELQGGPAVTLRHHGPYEEMGRSYRRILKHVKDRNYQVIMPTREMYLKGPGMIFRSNPRRFLTEIQFPIASAPNLKSTV